MKLSVVYEKGPTSWGAYVPDLPGVIAVGDTRAEAEHLIREAVELHVQAMREEGRAVPSQASFAGEIDVPSP